MNHAKILDCTLRDGAYLVDKKFGDNTIHGIINGLREAKIDIIEIGFLQDEGFGDGKTVYKNSLDAEKFVPADKGNTMYAVLADYSRYSIDNLDDYTGRSFDIVRACFFKKERFDVLEFCKKVKEKGYKLFIQPVDILGYTDAEILEFIELVNQIEPYCFSIVDTFGSMYNDDLQRIFSLLHHNLYSECRIGFHSHNNMQMSNSLSQEFLQASLGKRQVVVDTTISGMGRGAGNTPTELIVQYMVSKLGYSYDLDAILDIIDMYMDSIRSRCSWGYNTPYFIAGAYSAHVNNIAYLTEKPTIRSKDIRYILNKIGAVKRKRYDYDLLETTYLEYLESEIDDTGTISRLKDIFANRNVLMIAPGKSASDDEEIRRVIEQEQPIVITVNFLHNTIDADFVFISNIKRYKYWENEKGFETCKKILTSNISEAGDGETYTVSFTNLIKCGWENLDNASILLLRLLDKLEVASIKIVGLDGYDLSDNYLKNDMEVSSVKDNYMERNLEIQEMLTDYMETRKLSCPVDFAVPSRFRL